MANVSKLLHIDENYDCGEVVRDVVIHMRDNYYWLVPYTNSAQGKKIVKEQLKLDKTKPELEPKPKYLELLKRTPYTKLMVRSEEAECWLAAMALYDLKQQTGVPELVLCANYIIASDEDELCRFFKHDKKLSSVLKAIKADDKAEVPQYASQVMYEYRVPDFGKTLIMVAADFTDHGKLGFNRHVYAIALWRSESNLLHVLLMDPLNVSKSLHDFGLRIPTSLWRMLLRWGRVDICVHHRYGNETIAETDCLVRALIYAERLYTEPGYLTEVLDAGMDKYYLERVRHAAAEREEPSQKKRKVTKNAFFKATERPNCFLLEHKFKGEFVNLRVEFA